MQNIGADGRNEPTAGSARGGSLRVVFHSRPSGFIPATVPIHRKPHFERRVSFAFEPLQASSRVGGFRKEVDQSA